MLAAFLLVALALAFVAALRFVAMGDAALDREIAPARWESLDEGTLRPPPEHEAPLVADAIDSNETTET